MKEGHIKISVMTQDNSNQYENVKVLSFKELREDQSLTTHIINRMINSVLAEVGEVPISND